MSRSVDWLLLGRYALLVALTALIPIPLLDTGVENYLRRRMVRALAGRHGVTLDEEAVGVLGNAPGGGCVGCVWAMVMWPIKKVLRTFLIVFQVKAIADVASEVLHRGLMLEEALEMGWIPGDARKVRRAMDRSLDGIDTRLLERKLVSMFQDHTNDLNRVVFAAATVAREDLEAERELAEAVEKDTLGPESRRMSAAMTAAVRGTGLVPELLHWFRAEMGAAPGTPIAVGGVLEPAEILPPDPDPDPASTSAEERP